MHDEASRLMRAFGCAAALAVASALVGCDGKRSLGEYDGDTGAADTGQDVGSTSESPGASSASNPDDGAPPGTGAGIVGTWLGYADQLDVWSGSDRVFVEVTAVAGDGQVTGTAYFGMEGILPPPTDPEVGYPEGIDEYFLFDDFPIEQFGYALTGSFDGATARLLVTVAVDDVWTQWCALQTPYPTGVGSWGCTPNCGVESNEDGCAIPDDCEYIPGPIDCGKLRLCDGPSVCDCDGTSCTTNDHHQVEIDLHLTGDELSGPIDGQGIAYLTRQ